MDFHKIVFKQKPTRPYVIAGPCTAESKDLLFEVADPLVQLARELDFQLIFKASFDKANRTSIDSYRGPGIEKTLSWFESLKSKYQIPVLTDVHETHQAKLAAAVCDVLQIPAFLCRQTDLIIEAVMTKAAVNIKKGQFLAPENTHQIFNKVQSICQKERLPLNLAITERGTSFGYGDLVVDLRSFQIMAQTGAAVIFDITHSTQFPSSGGTVGEISSGDRSFAPILARGAASSGYVDGFFLEVHPQPSSAKSDAAVQLSITQATVLLMQIIPLWKHCQRSASIDANFK